MKQLIITLIFFTAINFATGQVKKDKYKLVNTFEEDFIPASAKLNEKDRGISRTLDEKYDIIFVAQTFFPSSGECSFNYTINNQNQTVSLPKGGQFTIFKLDNSVYVDFKYVSFTLNTKTPASSKVKVKFKVYRKQVLN